MDPQFVNSTNLNWSLLPISPCVDAGTPNTKGQKNSPIDIAGNVRIWDGNNDGISIIDIGAYEFGAPISKNITK